MKQFVCLLSPSIGKCWSFHAHRASVWGHWIAISIHVGVFHWNLNNWLINLKIAHYASSCTINIDRLTIFNKQIYHNGWFFAMFIDFKSSNFIAFIRENAIWAEWMPAWPFGTSFSSLCNVFLWKITNWPHFVISTSNNMFRHDCATHWIHNKIIEKKKMKN